MKYNLKLTIVAAGATAVVCSGCGPAHANRNSPSEEVKGKPNVILILADDMGYGDVSALNPQAGVKTPNIDKLVGEGVHFSNAHSEAAISSPSRYGIVTGRYCFRGPLQHGALPGYARPVLEKDRQTIASILKDGGYQTAVIGKWHLGLDFQTTDGKKQGNQNTDFSKPLTFSPNTVGFDYSYILPASLDMAPYVYIKNGIVEDQTMVDFPSSDPAPYRGRLWRAGKASKSFDINTCLAHFTDATLDYIRGHAKDEKPFFLYMPLTAPHTPWLPAPEYKGKSQAGDYGDFVMNVDGVVGQVISLMDSLKIMDNTVVIFATDNGSEWNDEDKAKYAHRANYIFRGRKSDIWDGGHHIPLVIRYPKLVKAASTSDALVCLNDILATVAQMTDTKIPTGAAEDSYSMLPAIEGNEPARKELIVQSNDGSFAFMKDQWKFVNCSGSGGWSQAHSSSLPPVQLYDLKADPGESVNLYQKYPEKVEQLHKEMDAVINR